jgi:hypothetical protein
MMLDLSMMPLPPHVPLSATNTIAKASEHWPVPRAGQRYVIRGSAQRLCRCQPTPLDAPAHRLMRELAMSKGCVS